MIEFTSDIDEFREMTKGLDLTDEQLTKATVSALNKTITSVRAFVVREVNRDYNVTQANIRKELQLSKANYSRLEASILGEGSPGIPLYAFSPSPKKAPSTRRLRSGGYRPKVGIRVMVRRGDRSVVKGAFVARMSSGHVGVFQRRGADSKIDELYGPSPLRILDSSRYYEKMDDVTEEIMDKNMAHEAEFYLQQAGIG